MSNITGYAAGSFSSGNSGDEEVQQNQLLHHQHQHQQEQLLSQDHFHGSNSGPSTTTNSNGSISPQKQQPPVKKKRNLPGTPDPNAEVIALSPKSLMATNRFVCEICKKGFQRDQNLQLHRRGHNLPWKLKQRTGNEIRKRVYICPETTCIHHNRARALGDLTGIKKHFCRKHGEKKWKCNKCSKKYAVQSDWKAHSKTCGTKEYKCDCGTIFSRRDSFITHRAFCDALTEENEKVRHGLTANFVGNLQSKVSKLMSSIGVPEFDHQETKNPLKPLPRDLMSMQIKSPSLTGDMFSSSSNALFSGPRNISSSPSCLQLTANSSSSFNNLHGSKMDGGVLGSSAHMSATALLQKAVQMGATASDTINSPMMQKTLAPCPDQFSGMITASYGGEMPQTDLQSQLARMDGGGFTNHFFDTVTSSRLNDVGMFPEMFMGAADQNHGFLKNINHGNVSRTTDRMLQGSNGNSGLAFGGDDMMTVDFLGIGGSRSTNLREHHQGLHPFQQQISHGQAAMEKSLWDV